MEQVPSFSSPETENSSNESSVEALKSSVLDRLFSELAGTEREITVYDYEKSDFITPRVMFRENPRSPDFNGSDVVHFVLPGQTKASYLMIDTFLDTPEVKSILKRLVDSSKASSADKNKLRQRWNLQTPGER